MLLIIFLCAVPAAVILLFASICRSARAPHEAPVSKWLAAEIARRGDRPQRCRLGVTVRRRHLAAVLPADARR